MQICSKFRCADFFSRSAIQEGFVVDNFIAIALSSVVNLQLILGAGICHNIIHDTIRISSWITLIDSSGLFKLNIAWIQQNYWFDSEFGVI